MPGKNRKETTIRHLACIQNENCCPEFGAKVHGPHGFLQSVSPDFGVVRSERAIAKNRMEEKRNRSHGHDQAGLFAGLLEVANDCIALVGCGVDGDEVIVVEIHSPGAYFRQHVDNFDGSNRRADKVAKRIAAAVAYGPKSKGELVVWLRLKGLRFHGSSIAAGADKNQRTPTEAQEFTKVQSACR